MKIPGIAKWTKYAGGISVPENKYAYSFGEYHISPYSSESGHFRGYQVWRYGKDRNYYLGSVRSPASAVKLAQEHEKSLPSGTQMMEKMK